MHNPWNENLPACAIRIEYSFLHTCASTIIFSQKYFYQSYIGSCMMCKAQMNQTWSLKCRYPRCMQLPLLCCNSYKLRNLRYLSAFTPAEPDPPKIHLPNLGCLKRWNNEGGWSSNLVAAIRRNHLSVSGSLYRYPQQLPTLLTLLPKKTPRKNWHGTSKMSHLKRKLETHLPCTFILGFKMLYFRGAICFWKVHPKFWQFSNNFEPSHGFKAALVTTRIRWSWC